ncbi:MAG: fluoride efflux transporter CrcB [Rhodocyclaceae bacterium]
MTSLRSVLAICLGASMGALLRWILGMSFNSLFPAIPPGTWLANMVGGYLVGVSVAFFALHVDLPMEWRLLVITGFLGGLTTFSTFSAEVTALIQQGRLALAALAIGGHVGGSLIMTFAGMATVSALSRS